MTLTFRSSAAEVIVHDYGAAKYTATRDGQNWQVTGHNERGEQVSRTIRFSNRFEASHQLLSLAMAEHDASRDYRGSSPRQDRSVSVDPMGNSMAAPIAGYTPSPQRPHRR